MKLFQKMSHNRARCLLCPRYCEIDDGCNGKCKDRMNLGGEIQPSTFGVVSSIAVEPIEKKPFKHFMPGTKTLSIGGFGCNLECKYCENEKISQSGARPDSKHFTPQDIIKVAKEKHCQSVCMTYNEPTIAIEYLLSIGELCHSNDLKFIIKTNAYINREPWKEVCKVVDAMNIDYKGAGYHFEDITQCRYDYGKGSFQWKMFDAFDNDVHVELSIPVFPDFKLEEWYFLPLQEVFNTYRKDVPCHLFKVNPAHLMIDSETTSDEDIERAMEALSHIFGKENIYV